MNELKRTIIKLGIHNNNIQKQSPEMFCKTRRFEKFRKFHKKIPVLGSLFNKVAHLRLE